MSEPGERVMGVAVSVTRLDHWSVELRSLARVEAGAMACRILAIAHVLDGTSRADTNRQNA